MLNTPGRAGVDRILAFPGGDTKVFDLAESNLANYVEVLNAFLVQFFSTGQIPPQYLLNQMANLSGDALAGAESTLSSWCRSCSSSAAAGHESLMELAWHAMGQTEDFSPGVETRWADAEARSFAQVIDAIVKLISTGFPKKDAWEMIPGTTPEKLEQWMDDYADEQIDAQLASPPVPSSTSPAPRARRLPRRRTGRPRSRRRPVLPVTAAEHYRQQQAISVQTADRSLAVADRRRRLRPRMVPDRGGRLRGRRRRADAGRS
jgi:hypothetical protein